MKNSKMIMVLSILSTAAMLTALIVLVIKTSVTGSIPMDSLGFSNDSFNRLFHLPFSLSGVWDIPVAGLMVAIGCVIVYLGVISNWMHPQLSPLPPMANEIFSSAFSGFLIGLIPGALLQSSMSSGGQFLVCLIAPIGLTAMFKALSFLDVSYESRTREMVADWAGGIGMIYVFWLFFGVGNSMAIGLVGFVITLTVYTIVSPVIYKLAFWLGCLLFFLLVKMYELQDAFSD